LLRLWEVAGTTAAYRPAHGYLPFTGRRHRHGALRHQLVGKLLLASGELTYVNEPLNPEHPPGHSPGVLGATVDQGYQYIHHGNEDGWLAAFNDTVRLRYHVGAELRRNRSPYDLARMARYATSFLVGRVLGRRALVDDPYAMLASEWLADRSCCTSRRTVLKGFSSSRRP
jgi:hypothetical protein